MDIIFEDMSFNKDEIVGSKSDDNDDVSFNYANALDIIFEDCDVNDKDFT